jgi:cobalt-zinc-cadmium efflux system membrane fusion protein
MIRVHPLAVGAPWPPICVLSCVICAAASLSSCTSDRPRTEPNGGTSEEGHAPADTPPAAEDDVVRVAPNMLSDLRVTTQAAESRPAGDVATVLGELHVDEDAYAEIGTSLPARVWRVLAAPGDVVTADQPVVELDSADVGTARGARLGAHARLTLARQTLERRRRLVSDQITPQRELEAAEAEVAEADADARAAEQSLGVVGAARGSGARFVLASPIAGTILERTALRGRMVDAERPLLVVGDLRRLWLIVHAFERDAVRMTAGASARVTFAALPGPTTSGSVMRIGSRVDPTSRTIDVRIDVDNPTGVLRPGMAASALIPLGDDAGTIVTVPVEAMQRQPQGWCVFLPRQEPGVFDVRPVRRGRDIGGEVEVVSGLRAGERVVVDGAFLLAAEANKARGGGEE